MKDTDVLQPGSIFFPPDGGTQRSSAALGGDRRLG
jgi:hypothetical protein